MGLFVREVKGWVKLEAAASMTEQVRPRGTGGNRAIQMRTPGKWRQDKWTILENFTEQKDQVLLPLQ